MKLIAVHAIQRRDAKGKSEAIAPKTPFEAEADEAQYLLRTGAARKADAGASEPEPEKAPVQGTSAATDEDAVVELANKTKAELIKFAADNGIEIDEKATKADILDTIAADQAADDELV